MALTLQQAAQQQAIAEGFALGPNPTLNPANTNTQAGLGNHVIPNIEPAPYYPPATAVTPNLGLSLQDLSVVDANNMVLIDSVDPTSLQSLMQGTVALPDLTSVQIPLTTLGAGDNYVYTVPVNSRAYAQVSAFNPTGSSITVNIRISKNGNVSSFRDGSNVVMTTATGTWFSSSLILEAGDSLNLNTTAGGLTSMGMAQQFSNSAKIRQVVFNSFVSGNNVVYTCPTGLTAVIPISEVRGTFDDTNGQVFLSNETGSIVTYSLRVKPKNGIVTQICTTGTVANNADISVNGNTFSTVLNEGDSLVLNTNSSTAGQWFRCNVYEF